MPPAADAVARSSTISRSSIRFGDRRFGVDETHDVRQRVVEEMRLDLRVQQLHPRERRLALGRHRARLVADGLHLRARRAFARNEDREQHEHDDAATAAIDSMPPTVKIRARNSGCSSTIVASQ